MVGMFCIVRAGEHCVWLRQVWRLKRGGRRSWAQCAPDFVLKTCCVVLRKDFVGMEKKETASRLCDQKTRARVGGLG